MEKAKIPELLLNLQTAHKLDEEGAYDPETSLYIIADWRAPGVRQWERVDSPIGAKPGRIDVAWSGRTLGLIEESVVEAEQVLAPQQA